MRFIKKCRWIKTFLAAILIISITSQSLTAYAETDGITAGSKTIDDIKTTSGDTYSGEGWVISIQEVENTATESNTATGSYVSDCSMSLDNAWLYKFPSCYYSTDGDSLWLNPEKYAFIGNSETSTDSSKKYYVANPEGGTSRSPKAVQFYRANSYGSGSLSASGQIIEKSNSYNTILEGIKSYGESITVNKLYEYVDDDLTAAKKAFVNIWRDSGSAADEMNEFVFGTAVDSSGNYTKDYYDIIVSYLDLLLIVNSLCDRAWDDYITDFLEKLNQDNQEKYVVIVIAAVVNYTTGTGGSQALMTLPVYYARRSGLGTANYSSWDGTGGDWNAIRDRFNSDTPNNRTGYNMGNTSSGGNTQKIWWNEGESGSAHMATSVYPIGSDGSLGFCGYTYISTGNVSSPDPEDTQNTSNPSSTAATDSLASLFNVTPTFTVEVTTENEYMQRDKTQPVTATVTIDMSQDDSVRKAFNAIYSRLEQIEAETGESYKTAIEVFVERTFSDSSGKDATNAVMDSDASNGYFKFAVQPDPYTNCVVYRWQGTDWDSGSNQLKDVMDGTNQIIFDDEGLSLEDIDEGKPLNATYHVGIRMAIYPSSVSDEDAFGQAYRKWIFQGEGKTICSDSGNSDCSTTFFNNSTTSISTTQSAHDDAEWICPNGVQWYSSLRDEKL